MNKPETTPRKSFISLRIKLLVVFSVLFAVIFAGTFFWFYQFSSQRAIQRLAEDLNVLLAAAHNQVSGDDLAALVAEGQPSADGNSSHPVYVKHADFFTQLKQIDPRGSAYTMIRKNDEYMVVTAAEAFTKPDSSADFLAPIGLTVADVPTDFNELFDGKRDSWFLMEPYEDPFGQWISGYRAVYNGAGQAVGVVGVDFRAEYYQQVRDQVLRSSLIAFLLAYVVVFITVYAASVLLSRPINKLELLAQKVGEGDYEVDFTNLSRSHLPDEITKLASVFSIMVDKVHSREIQLKKRVQDLEIVIEEKRLTEQVSEITDTEFFTVLTEKAKEMRAARHSRVAGTAD